MARNNSPQTPEADKPEVTELVAAQPEEIATEPAEEVEEISVEPETSKADTFESVDFDEKPKLTGKQKASIKKFYNEGKNYQQLADKYKVTVSEIDAIVTA